MPASDDMVSIEGTDTDSPAVIEVSNQPGVLNLSHRQLSEICSINNPWRLEHLILDGNQLRDTLRFPLLPALETLSINNNKIFNLDNFLPYVRASCPNLSYISLMGNPACPYPAVELDSNACLHYRRKVADYLPKLNFIDHIPIRNKDRSDQQRKGRSVYTRSKKTFSGRLSEGNRFIVDQHL